jgi:gamma-butyrobetaine dioxygenase
MPCLRITAADELTLDSGRGERIAIHPLWLRERCEDARSMDAKTGQRLHDPSDLPLDLRVAGIEETAPGRYRIGFTDGHVADFTADAILAEAALAPGDHDTPPLQLWDASLKDFPRAAWKDCAGREAPAEWIDALLRWGFLIIGGVPTHAGSVLAVAQVFGFVRETNFGKLFDVRSAPQAIDLAYTPLPLDAHTDNPYRDPVPGIQLLHCLVNETRGGFSTLVDGFAVAGQLRKQDPDAFHVLSRTPVRFRYRDDATELVASALPIELDATGTLRAIHFSPRLDFVPLLPAAQLNAYYRSRRAFDHLLRSPAFEIRFLLGAGDLLIMDNRRLLHGRTGFDPAEGVRHLQGCYIDGDGPRSLYRVQRRRNGGLAERKA